MGVQLRSKTEEPVAEPLVENNKEEDMPEPPKPQKTHHKYEIYWAVAIYFFIAHVVAVICAIRYLKTVKLATIVWAILVGYIGEFGVTAGAHRYYSHKSFKAKLPLQVILLACYSVAGQKRVTAWASDHRLHHKFSDTDGDPHNATRGLFFSHIGWIVLRRHPEVHRLRKIIDMSDLDNDPLVQFHTKYFRVFFILLSLVIPITVPAIFWNENWMEAICISGFLRLVVFNHFVLCINSLAHYFGSKPYDKRIRPVQSLTVSLLTSGEGWHNYHHTFPWDYSAQEYGGNMVNGTTLLLDMFAKIGWAYDLKRPSTDLVRKVALRHGDGSWQEVPDTEAYFN
ncbi:acyl-CoA Delta-9 desaturase-like [Adelges cooleyi]|uniref:acyl-CoA Delta-9 desaturase-like n=1 Tax=Adelges cooleyi TaxID=133065 RepID=UPI0021809108|nr:acyl-CoA Delta-9 desaturase-like [Adelges cooleyi]XP_050430364.1 acyl-CoA Delta-9 desaturase-like [Adelges cooleyi]